MSRRRPDPLSSTIVLFLVLLHGHAGAHPEVELKEADVDLGSMDVVMDAPWRVQRRPGRTTPLPVLYFFPETKAGWRSIEVLRVRIEQVEQGTRYLLFEDTREGAPVIGAAPSGLSGEGMRVVDAWGRTSADLDVLRPGEPVPAQRGFVFPRIDDESRGWHVLFRLVVPEVPESDDVTLHTDIDYRRLGADDDGTYTIARRHHVRVEPDPLPSFEGWVSYDAHVHTLAEYSSDLSYRAIRKAYGGPVQMFRECAVAVGLVDSLEAFKHRVITTDHNTFFSDREFVRHGPTTTGISPGGTGILRPELKPYFVDLKGQHVAEGQREFENYLDLYGITFGQEITLAKTQKFLQWISGTLGSHLLAYSTRHFMGPFHGGSFFVFRDEENPNTLEGVLHRIATDPRFPHGFAFAAHPFSPSRISRSFLTEWTEDQIQTAIKGEFIRREGDRELEFAFKGFELWNEKKSRLFHTPIIVPDRLRELKEDPTVEELWKAGNPNWDRNLQYGLGRYHQFVADQMRFYSASNPRRRYIRKFYVSAGTDAHGDFNRDNAVLARGLAALPGIVSRFMKAFSVSDNAFGKVRTVVDPRPAGLSDGPLALRALRALARGQGVISDGPVIDFEIDAVGRFDGETLTWHPEPTFEDTDGRMGGDGSMDGLRTALIPAGGRESMLRYRWRGAPAFGGELERLEVYVDEAGDKVELVPVDRNTGRMHVLEHQGFLDAAAPVGDAYARVRLEDAFGSRSAGRGGAPVRTLSAISLGGFTRRRAEPPYDFRCYTNPIWLVPVKLGLAGAEQGGVIPPGGLTVTFTFPISMKDEVVPCFLETLGSDGGSSGTRYSLEPALGRETGVFTPSPREEIDDNVLIVTNPDPVPITLPAGSPGFVLVLQAPRDAHENRLNSLAWQLVPSPGGLTPAPLRPAP